jgi:uncharacterized membrane protein
VNAAAGSTIGSKETPPRNPVEDSSAPSFEAYPLTRPEYINALVHFYRGEMHRSQVWRIRLDTTTNWAVLTTAAMISFGFSDPAHSHLILLLSHLLISAFLAYEARRYRYFSVYRARVRMLEENFFIPMIRRNLVSPKEDWREFVAMDLDVPKFKSTLYQAIGFRLRRNYIWIYLILLVTWVLKIFMHPTPAESLGVMYARMGVGPISAPIIIVCGLILYAAIIGAVLSTVGREAATDEVHGIEREMEHWKI